MQLVRDPDALTLAAATWLACGVVLLGLTPLPLHAATGGWSLAYWLLGAPALVLITKAWLATRNAPEAEQRTRRVGARQTAQAVRVRRARATVVRKRRRIAA